MSQARIAAKVLIGLSGSLLIGSLLESCDSIWLSNHQIRHYPYGPLGFYPYVQCLGLFCGPFDYACFASPVYAGSLAYADDKGQVRLVTDPKTADVYIDGAYAGSADHLRTMWLDSGAYDLSVSAKGRAPFHQRIYILSGKSLKILAKLQPESALSPARHETEERG